jgi:acyl-CoA hydrolase
MNAYAIVRTGHLNHHGFLFGGQLLKWVDEYAWLAAARDFPGYKLVTRAMEKVEFKTPVRSGSILRFRTLPQRMGHSSITYSVEVFADAPGVQGESLVFSNSITFACVDDSGIKRELPSGSVLRSQMPDMVGETYEPAEGPGR